MKKRLALGIAFLLVVVCALVILLPKGKRPGQIGRLKLPVGPVQPQVGFGFAHGIILAGDGSLWSWGERGLGWPVLGTGTNLLQPGLKSIGKETNWTEIAVGQSHNLALKSDGTIWAWGEDLRGQLGDGRAAMQNTPVASVPGNDWKHIAAGANHSLALKQDGTLWAWGLNNFGELGIGSVIDSRVAVQVGSATNWTKVRAGGSQTAGIQSDGSLWLWGASPLLGNSKALSTNHFLVPTRISPDTNWVDTAMDYGIIFAIKADGTLWALGGNAHIYNGFHSSASNAVPTRVGTNADWKACSMSSFYAVLMKTNGSLWEIDASAHTGYTLRPIVLQKDFVASAGGRRIGAAVTRDREVWTWGKGFGERKAFAAVSEFCADLFKNTPLNGITWVSEDVFENDPWQLANQD